MKTLHSPLIWTGTFGFTSMLFAMFAQINVSADKLVWVPARVLALESLICRLNFVAVPGGTDLEREYGDVPRP